ncbi:sensor domain-containing phosphodiesterase [Marinobacter sp. NP-4(2019)]|uniref:sensor domain-containing phosphodiesterase n=1 Tax=Marinobacter sp. NP-4(2019) TaxID=2488665 RepID=UPI000FC3D8F0|nr:sensor domain-containing phosphodiesterase [Marinobacter sp. NP-4(2019)]AZT83301.1 sensor domain-containing phosphodiesterase [Marinobacter sp. NP-4(2019)]
MDDSATFVSYHKALMELSHDAGFIRQPRHHKLSALASLCGRLLEVERVSVWFFPPERDRITCECLYDKHQVAETGPQSVASGEKGLSSVSLYRSDHPGYFQAISEERILAVNDARNDPRTSSFNSDYLPSVGIHSMLDAPVFDGSRLSGVVCLEACHPREWTLPELSFAISIADTISLINTHEAWVHSKRALDFVSRFDTLTGLANIDSLKERVIHLAEKIRRRKTGSLALIWIDVDRLKAINDGLGPQAGDSVIAEIGQRLKALRLEGKDLLARIGGDEFAILIRHHTQADALNGTAERIQEAIRQPIRVSGQSLSISASMGICHLPEDCVEPQELLRGAEAAMYHAKNLGRARATVFDSAIQISAQSRFALERELRAAISGDALDVFYQPIVDQSGKTVISIEALVRWNHPQRGWLPPIEFLDIARGSGLMYTLGECVLRRVCKDWSTADSLGIHLPVISVNLSAEQVLTLDLPDRIKEICAKHRMPVSALQFEVTEDSIQGDFNTLAGVLETLVDAGAKLAIDDFGTGYSSLARLKSLPFSHIKIDRSFISDLPDDENDCAITLSIIGLARGLGLSVVAEGVETEAHEQWLIEKGCDLLQGYFYSKPQPFNDLMEHYFLT